MKAISFFGAVFLFLAISFPTSAAVGLLRSYHLGDLDTEASNNVIATTSQDYVGNTFLSFAGGPKYSNDVPIDYPLVNTYSMNFNVGSYGTAPVISNVVDNFGLSAWVKVRSIGGNRAIAYNGDSGSSGWGLYQVNNTFQGLLGGVAVVGSAPVETNVWTHLALVRNQGVATLYVNGVACGTKVEAPNPPAGSWAVGSAPPSLSDQFFDGLIDEVFVFTNQPGAFSTNDLACRSADSRKLSVVSGTNVVISWPVVRSDFNVQFTTNLASGIWTTLSHSTNGNLFTVTNPPSSVGRFYRLIKPAFDPGTPIAPLIRLKTTQVYNGATTEANINPEAFIEMNSEANVYEINASNTLNPRTGTAEGLGFYWLIDYGSGTGFSDAGITGYRRPILKIAQTALPSNTDGAIVTFYLILTNKADPATEVVVFFESLVSNTLLTLTLINECQSGGNFTVCPTCPCKLAVELPATDPNDLP